MPKHGGGGRGDIGAQHFVPADHALAVGIDETIDAMREPVLVLPGSGKAMLLHPLAAAGAAQPGSAPHFVTTDVNKSARKQRHDLGENIFNERKGGFVTQ